MITSLYKKEEADDIPFPSEVFPQAVRSIGAIMAESLNCNDHFVFASMLVTTSIGIGSRHKIKIKEGWLEGPVLYMVIVGNPGTRKTPAIIKALSPVLDKQKSYAVKPSEENSQENKKEEPKTILTTDATLESLAELLSKNPHGIVLYMDELMALLKGFNQYKSGGNDQEKFLSFWSQTVCVITRKKKANIQINNPFVTLIGGIQEEILVSLSDMKGNGFVDRLLFVYPKPVRSKHTNVEIPKKLMDDYARMFNEIFDVAGVIGVEERVWPFSIEAQELWNSWHTDYCEAMNADDLPYYIKGTLTKLEAYTARFALILAFLHFGEGSGELIEEIGKERLEGAIKLTEYFKSQAMKVYSSFVSSSQERQIEKTIAWFMKQPEGKAPIRRVYTNKVGGVKNFSEAYDLLCEMRSRALGKLIEVSENGKQSYQFVLNPTLLKKTPNN